MVGPLNTVSFQFVPGTRRPPSLPPSFALPPKVGLKHFDVILPPFWGLSTFSRPGPLPRTTASEKKKKKAGGRARERKREREREREKGEGAWTGGRGEKGVEWVGRVTVARQPILGSDSYSTPSCTTTLHKQSFPFSLWHKQHSWELTAAGDRAPHTCTHRYTCTHTRHMFTCLGKGPRVLWSTNRPTQKLLAFGVLAQVCDWESARPA